MAQFGTIPRYSLQSLGFVFVTLDDGREAAFGLIQGFSNLETQACVRWPWDVNFTSLGFMLLTSDEFDAVTQIIQSAPGLWTNPPSPTWEDISNGTAPYVSPTDGKQYFGGQGLAKRFQDWVSVNTVHDCEVATDAQWFGGSFMPQLQAWLDSTFAAAHDPGIPVFPPPTNQFPPQQVGPIESATGLMIAQATRLTATKDPANGNRVIAARVPVP